MADRLHMLYETEIRANRGAFVVTLENAAAAILGGLDIAFGGWER